MPLLGASGQSLFLIISPNPYPVLSPVASCFKFIPVSFPVSHCLSLSLWYPPCWLLPIRHLSLQALGRLLGHLDHGCEPRWSHQRGLCKLLLEGQGGKERGGTPGQSR